MKAKRKAILRKATTKKTATARRRTKLRKTAGASPLERRRELIRRGAGYTGERGDARSATSGIP